MQRRGFLAGIGASVLLPSLVHAQGSAVTGDFVLERVLRRGLSKGLAIEVTRRWAITLAPSPEGGLRVTGTQIDAHVDAPPALQAIARMEEEREEHGFLPLLLDQEGLILPENGSDSLAPLPEEAISAALAYARSRTQGLEAAGVSRQFFADLSEHSQNWLTMLPRDLFFPAPRDRSMSREIALPDGIEGVVRMRETATADPATGLLLALDREATTTTAEFSRSGSETWTLERAVS
tara:strand:+ start:1113 stop:1820 length:708 start_codon:yes stop_codon:yes gene_type:complete